MDEKPKRRWFRFSLRTFLLVVTAICLWFGWNYRIVHERREVLRMLQEKVGAVGIPQPGEVSKLSWIRRALGHKHIFGGFSSLKGDEFSKEDEARVRAAFPEVEIRALKLTDYLYGDRKAGTLNWVTLNSEP